jgi:hypothetical protein
MAKKADEVTKSLGVKPIPKEEAQNFYSGERMKETVQIEEPKGKEKTVIGIVEAEKLQKAGWTLISATRPSEDPFGDKEYKFERNK